MSFVDRQLQDDEDLVMFVRHYPASYLLKGVVLFLYFLLPFFFLFPLWDAGMIGRIVFGLLLVSALLLVTRFWAVVYFNSLIITDRRIIEIQQKGLFEQHVSEVQYEKIQNISYAKKGLLQMILGFGSVFVHSSSQAKPIEIKHVHNPRGVREMIVQLMDERSELSRKGLERSFEDITEDGEDLDGEHRTDAQNDQGELEEDDADDGVVVVEVDERK